MAQQTFVCWNCRRAARNVQDERPGRTPPRCPQCREALTPLSTKVEIPSRTDERGWVELREDQARYARYRRAERERAVVARLHSLERRIRELKGRRPVNRDRDRLIRELEEQAARIRGER